MNFCQSCGMPMDKEELFGLNSDGSKNEDYCTYCFKDGKFNSPNETVEEMIETCVPYYAEAQNVSKEEARKILTDIIPTLKRWRQT